MQFSSIDQRIGRVSPGYTSYLLLFTFIISSGAAPQCPPVHVFTGEAPNDFFGSSVSGAGDVNNDGFTDLIVGAPGNQAGGFGAGRAYVYSGQTGALLHTFTGESAGDDFGSSVASAGDVNNDGYCDLIVGAFLSDSGGSAYVYSGQTGGLLYTFTSEAAGDQFGVSVSGAGDVNNDGYADLIVGARTYAGTWGRAYVYSGQTGELLHAFDGEGSNNYLGRSVSGAGDVNNDGFADLIVGSNWSGPGGSNPGRAYVYSGQNGAPLHTFTGESVSDWSGASVSGAGDVNNDGFADLIMGARFNDAGGNNAGRAYVYSGQTGALLRTFTGEAAGDQFGYSVSGAGDVNNDGFADLIVGAITNDAGGLNSGRAYVYSGQTGALLHTFTGEAAGDFFGYSVSVAGDVNNDGFVYLIVGARGSDSGGSNAGRAYVFAPADSDGDLISNACDNCPNDFNQDQTDTDGDNVGDACDNCPGFDNSLDADGDCVADSVDNCPNAYNPDQADTDVDGIADSCDNCPSVSNADQTDADSDGFGVVCDCDDADSLINSSTIWYEDADGDGFGNVGVNLIQCDQPPGFVLDDTDCDDADNLLNPNTVWYEDADGDGFGNVSVTLTQCDQPPGFVLDDTDCDDADNLLSPNTVWHEDPDGDGYGNLTPTLVQCQQPAGYVLDSTDNCPDVPNPDQADADSNGIGDACDACCETSGDANGDGSVNIADVTFLIARIFAGGSASPCCEEGNANGDGAVNIADVTFLIARIFAGGPAPICGPAGMGC